MKKYYILFLAALAMTACSKDLPEEAAPEFVSDAMLTVRAMNEQTRTSTEDGLTFNIVENEEQIGVYIQNFGYTEENILFTAGSKDEQEGWIPFEQSEASVLRLQNGTRVLAYAPYTSNNGTITGSVESGSEGTTRAAWNGIRTMSLSSIQTQKAPSSVEHLTDYYSLVARPTEVTSEDGINYRADLRFSGIFALIRIIVLNDENAANDVSVSKVVFSAEDAALTGAFRVNLTEENPSITNAEYSPAAVEGKCSGSVTVAFAEPVTLKPGEQAELYAVVNAAAVVNPEIKVCTTVAGEEVVYKKTFESTYDITRRKRTSFGVKLESSSVYDYAQEVANVLTEGGKIVIEQDVDLSDKLPVSITKEVELVVPEGFTVKVRDNEGNNICVDNGGSLTVSGGGLMTGDRGILCNFGGNLTIDGITVETTNATRGSGVYLVGGQTVINDINIKAAYYAVCSESADANAPAVSTINGGTFESTATNCYAIRCTINASMTINDGVVKSPYGAVAVDESGDLTINGGHFSAYGGKNFYALQAAGDGKATVNGGYFYNDDNNAAAGCIRTSNNDVNGWDNGIIVLQGGYFKDKGSDKFAEGGLRAAEGYKWKKLAEPVTVESDSYTGTYNYKIVKSTPWAGEIEEPEYDESSKTYLIADAAELAWVAEQTNAGTTFSGKTVKLIENIDLNAFEWTPIGTVANPFAGTFDGGDHTVSNLRIDNSDLAYAGLFGRMVDPAVLKNVTIENASVSGKSQVGALVGQGYTGRIENCHVTGTIQIQGAYQVGGLTGQGYASITNCSVKGDAGSLVCGYYVEDNLEGDAIGGLVGYSCERNLSDVGYISQCDVEINVYGSRKVGGIAGQCGRYANLFQCSYKGDVICTASEGYIDDNKGKIMVGGMVGELTGTGTQMFIKESTLRSGSSITGVDANTTGLLLGGSRTAGYIFIDENNIIEDGVTMLPKADFVQVSDNAWTVKNADGLVQFAAAVNSGDTFSKKTITLAEDLDLSGIDWTPIGESGNTPFQGTFDGGGHTISNLTADHSDWRYVGLFGYTKNGVIKNVVIENATINAWDYAGVIAGNAYTSKISDITIKGDVKVESQGQDTGGIAGYTYGSVTDVTIEVNAGSYVKGSGFLGGVIGYVGEGNIKLERISSNIDVIGKSYMVGGIAGMCQYGNQFTDCSCSGNVSITAGEEPGRWKRLGGIAGSWNDEKETYTTTLTNCTFTGTLSSHSTSGNELTEFENNGLVGRAYNAPNGKGKLIIDGVQVWPLADFEQVSDNEYIVRNAAGLREFAAAVNAGDTFSKKTITLDADINLNSEEWTPIGNASNPFKGDFNGNGKTISNLVVTRDGQHDDKNNNIGLFGYSLGTDSGFTPKIHDFTIHNASVTGGYLNSAVVCGGTHMDTKFYNIDITGHVEVEGYTYTGAIVGKGYFNIDNCHVNVDATSYVKGDWIYIGGIYGFGGEGNRWGDNISDYQFHVVGSSSNINVSGLVYVGGIGGLCEYGVIIDDCHVAADITTTITAEQGPDESDKNSIGGIAGITVSHDVKCCIRNCSFTGKLNTNFNINHDGVVGGDRSGNVEQTNLILENNTVNLQ